VAAGVGSGVDPDPGRALADALGTVAAGLGGEQPTLVAVFIGEAHAAHAAEISSECRRSLDPVHLIGVTAGAVVAGPAELEQPDAVAVWAAVLPGARITPLTFPPPPEGAGAAQWPDVPQGTTALVVFADPYSFPADAFLAWLGQRDAAVTVSGGLASARAAGTNRLLLDDQVHDSGAVAVALGGDVRLQALVSQGCRPVGRTWVVTRAQRNVITELAGAPAVDRLRETYQEADPAERALMEQGLHIGLVFDEYQEAFGPGDFLIRAVLGADEDSGSIAVGDLVRVGQTVQFQVRDADSARDDLRAVLTTLDDPQPAGALLFTCNGRGSRLFGTPGHDAGLVSATLGGAPLAGFFAAGEFGPVGARSFLHGFTASILLLEPGGGRS
jgi:small ligand-binding sensory domain FIST